ncbi:hypothetical protein SAMN05421743_101471 [Thalassobacillus cyri]|uniref:Uncharacterized protein n=1 Tax=Thalassobacillus cyri TaxID=571932 RepID=A0A1H3WKJ7_9BACI|nr:hypothetical protein [Thalassobacillus cyri]SDZ86718.1 hypothetical protein SAMN05421743_101471 [Thalassobacillus cyri]
MFNLYSIDQRVEEKKRKLDHINRHAWKSASLPKKKLTIPSFRFWKKQSAPLCCAPCC